MRSEPQIWHLIVGLAVQHAPGRLLVFSIPLFEEEGCSRGPTHRLNLVDPLWLHFPSSRATLTADDRPMDAGQITPRYRPDQRLKRNEPNRRRHQPNRIQPIWNAI